MRIEQCLAQVQSPLLLLDSFDIRPVRVGSALRSFVFALALCTYMPVSAVGDGTSSIIPGVADTSATLPSV